MELKRALKGSLCCALGILAVLVGPSQEARGQEVSTDTGSYVSTVSHTKPEAVKVYLGIRYAASTAGAARWTPPQSPAVSTQTIYADTPGPSCEQPGSGADTQDMSEDCLFLNVYAPATAQPGARLPVMFWIHGGNFFVGAGKDYDPSSLVAENNIIVVTINYRLGVLGWLAAPSLAAQQEYAFEKPGDSGNYGLMDQQFALAWVERNIANFGGDPQGITLAGQSSGGSSVYSLLASTKTPRNLHGAIIESAARRLNTNPSLSDYEDAYDAAFYGSLGLKGPAAPTAAELRSLPASSFEAADLVAFGLNFSPVTRTKLLPEAPLIALQRGRYVHTPILQGTNANEGRLYEPALVLGNSDPQTPPIADPASVYLTTPNTFCTRRGEAGVGCTYEQEVGAMLTASGLPESAVTPQLVSAVAQRYPLADFPNPNRKNAPSADEALAQIFTDFTFSCKSTEADEAASAITPGRTFSYEFDDPGAEPLTPVPNVSFPLASAHTAELRYIFDFPPYPGATWSAPQEQLARQMRTYWGNFVRSGYPNFPRVVPAWQPYVSPQTKLRLTPGFASSEPDIGFEKKHACLLWAPYLINSGPLGRFDPSDL